MQCVALHLGPSFRMLLHLLTEFPDCVPLACCDVDLRGGSTMLDSTTEYVIVGEHFTEAYTSVV